MTELTNYAKRLGLGFFPLFVPYRMTFLSRKLAGRAETDLGLWSKPDWKRKIVHAFDPVIDTKIAALSCCADLEHKDGEHDYPSLFDFVIPVHRYV